ncbi:hypothetical protein L3Q82_010393, partial [Scortum barcoo]
MAYIQTAKRLNSHQARWVLFFSCFDFTLTYRPGSRNVKPDALSRPPPATSLPVPGRPWSHIALDFVTGLPRPRPMSQSNGQTEGTNQDLELALRCVTAANLSTWSTYLPWIKLSHNSLVRSATGLSPFEASLRYQPLLFPRQEHELVVPSIQHYLQRCKAVCGAEHRQPLRLRLRGIGNWQTSASLQPPSTLK